MQSWEFLRTTVISTIPKDQNGTTAFLQGTIPILKRAWYIIYVEYHATTEGRKYHLLGMSNDAI